MLAGLAFELKSGTNFPTGILRIVFVHDIAKWSEIIVPFGTVHAVIYGDKTNTTLTQYLHDLTDFQIASRQSAHVLKAIEYSHL